MHEHIIYCFIELRSCTDYEMSEFPLRMREWLYFVMEELASRDTLDNKGKQMARRAEQLYQEDGDDVSDTQRWMIPVMWKFCQLDETHDE